MPSEEEARLVKQRYSSKHLGRDGICGVGVEKDEAGNYVISIHLDTDDPAVRARLPGQIEGYPVKPIFSGPFRKFARG
jgi:hypothetical protein